MNAFSRFIPLTKVDVEQRLVYGIGAIEMPDHSREIFDYDTSKPLIQEWSDGIAKASGGKSLGNVRAMHGKTAAGKLTALNFDDASKAVELCSKVVDDQEWEKVLEGVYTGFSVGGSYVKKWKDPNDPTLTRYTAKPSEWSLVDNPCIPGATFQMVKADGLIEKVAFTSVIKQPTDAEVAAHAETIAKVSGGIWTDHIEKARADLIAKASTPAERDDGDGDAAENQGGEESDTAAADADADEQDEEEDDEETEGAEKMRDAGGNEIVFAPGEDPGLYAVWRAKDGSLFRKKAAASAHNEALTKRGDPTDPANALNAALSNLGKALDKAEGIERPETPGIAGMPALAADLKKWAAVLTEAHGGLSGHMLMKGMYNVCELANVIQHLQYVCDNAIWERAAERDDSKVPEMLALDLAGLGAALIAMAKEEVGEMIVELSDRGVVIETVIPEGEMLELAAGVDLVKSDAAIMEKVGARNSKNDAARMQKMHDLLVELGAKCAGGDAEKLAKAEGLETENEALKKRLEASDALMAKATESITALTDRVVKLESLPMPGVVSGQNGAPVFKVVDKAQDDALASDDRLRDRIENDREGLAHDVIKLLQSQPMTPRY